MSTIRGTVTPAISFTNQPTTSTTAGQVTEIVLPGSPLQLSYAYGTGAGQVDTIWSQGAPGTTYSLSGTSSINLMALTNGVGGAISFARVKVFYVVNNTPGTTLTIGGGSNAFNTAWASTITLNGGEVALFATTDATGHTVNGTTNTVQFVASAPLSATVVIAGCSV